VTTVAGSSSAAGSADGIGTAALFAYPKGVAVDAAGNVYVADTNNATIRKITSGGSVTTIAGMAGAHDSVDGGGLRRDSHIRRGLRWTARATCM
jgi:DNA-binding beta-propeller fold protein YncE